MFDSPLLEPQISAVSNANLGSCFYCINPNNFISEIYPKLVEIKQNGTEVLCIGGDIGVHAKEFEHLTSDGIHFLASGIDAETGNNLALLFSHDPSNKNLKWEFVPLADL